MAMHRRKRTPKLRFTENRGLGWHVTFRDPTTGIPTKKRLGLVSEQEARVLYHGWLAGHLGDEQPAAVSTSKRSRAQRSRPRQAHKAIANNTGDFLAGSLLDVATSLLHF